MSEEVKSKIKALFPENVEGIYVSKNDYNRLYGDLTLQNIKLKEEIERLNIIIGKARKMIFDNYGVLDKYEIELLDDILKGEDNE